MKGKLHAGPDPKGIMWSMWWVHHQILKDPLHLYRANIFYPAQNALAHSDSLIVPSLTSLPFRIFTREPTVLFNLAFVIAFASAGFFMYLLVFNLTKSRAIAVIGGIFYAFSPFRLDNITHLQYASHQWLPLAVLSLVLFFIKKRKGYIFAFSAFAWLTAMSCAAYLVMAIIPFAFLIFYLWLASPLNKKQIITLILAGVIFIVAFFPFFYKMYEVKKSTGQIIDQKEVVRFSLDVLDVFKQPKYLTSAPYSILPEQIKNPYFSPFPGFVASAFILAAAVLFFLSYDRRKASASKQANKGLVGKGVSISRLVILASSTLLLLVFIFSLFSPDEAHAAAFNHISVLTWVLLLSLMAYAGCSAWNFKTGSLSKEDFFIRLFLSLSGMMVLFSLGPYLHFNGKILGQNMYWAINQLPGFNAVRQMMHWHTFTMLFAVPAACLAMTKLNLMAKKSRWIVFAALFALIAAEYRTDMSRDFVDVPLEVPAMYQWLATEPPESPILELPMYGYPYHPEGDRMYWSMYHKKPLVNGLFSYPPREYHDLLKSLENFPSKEGILYIQNEYELKYIVVRLRHYSQDQLNQMEVLFSQDWSHYKLNRKWQYFWVFENQNWNDSSFYKVN